MINNNKIYYLLFLFVFISFVSQSYSQEYLKVPPGEVDCIDKIAKKLNLKTFFPTNSAGQYITLCSGTFLCHSNNSIARFYGKADIYTDVLTQGAQITVSDLLCLPYMNDIYTENVPVATEVYYYQFPYVTAAAYHNTGMISITAKFPKLNSLKITIDNRQLQLKMSYVNDVSLLFLTGNNIDLTVDVDSAAVGTNLKTLDLWSRNLPNLSKYNFESLRFTFHESFNSNDIISNYQYIKSPQLYLFFRTTVPFYIHLNSNIKSLEHSGSFSAPNQLYDLSTFDFDKLKLSGVGNAFVYQNNIPIKVSSKTNIEYSMYNGVLGTLSLPIPSLAVTGKLKQAVYDYSYLSGNLPTFSGQGGLYSYPNNKITGQIDSSWCTTNLVVTNNQLTGTVYSSLVYSAPGNTLQIKPVYDRFTGNQFTNLNKNIPCTTYKPQITYYNSTTLIITGQDIGHEISHYYTMGDSFYRCLNLATAVIRLGLEYYCNVNYARFDLQESVKLTNTALAKTITFALISKAPVVTSISTTNNNQISIAGSFFSSYLGYSVQSLTISGVACTINDGDFNNIKCLASIQLGPEIKLVEVKNGGQSKKVYAVFQNDKVNNLQCPNDCVGNPNGDICDLSTGQCIGCPNGCSSPNGVCNESKGRCDCNSNYQGPNCATPFIQCPSFNGQICNAAGTCNNQTGICTCDSSHQGNNCGTPFVQCPSYNGQICNGAAGTCDNTIGKCTCNSNYQGPNCGTPFVQCPSFNGQLCNAAGTCDNTIGKCTCDSSHQGLNCATPFIQCPSFNGQLCNAAGTCNNQTGICTCDSSHQGNNCGTPFVQCPSYNGQLCNGAAGTCDNTIGKCTCDSSHQGLDCGTPFVQCPSYNNQICNNAGSCDDTTGICSCDSSHQGDNCGTPFIQCPSYNGEICNGASGNCDDTIGKCTCDSSHQGDNCGTPFIQCPFVNSLVCNAGGTCNNQTGVCLCDSSHQGNDCGTPFIQCPSYNGEICNGASGNCDDTTGKCTCDSSHQGDNCGTPFIECPTFNGQLCNDAGNCDDTTGVCTCDSSHQGDNCGTPFIPCPIVNSLVCNDGGSCNNQTGVCLCDSSHQGNDCGTPFIQCPSYNGEICNGASGNCDDTTGVCTCDSSHQGDNCGKPLISCPVFETKTCNSKGTCNNETGICKCDSGFQGQSCEFIEHYITAVYPSNENGGVASFIGHFGMDHNGLSIKIGNNDCIILNISNDQINCTALPGTGIHSVNITQNNIIYIGKNIYEYIKVDQTVDCPKNCSSHGICLKSGDCDCFEGYSSYDCSSISNNTNPNTNIDEGTGVVDIDNELIKFNIYLSTLKEVDINNNIVKSYPLISDWTVNKTNSNVYTFEQSPNKDDFKVISTIELVTKERNVSFAGVDFKLEKDSTKFTISIQNYKYQSFLNTLQLEMVSNVTELKTSGCNNKDTNLDSNYFNNQYQSNYIKLSKNNIDFVGRFINKVVSDSKPTFLSTSYTSLNDSVLITLHLPKCVSECLIDPDFSVLLSSDFSTCKAQKENIKWKIPVGVVVGAVGLSCIGILFYKKKALKINGQSVKMNKV